MNVVPFRALRPAPGFERRVSALPYDVVELAEAQELVAAEPLSFLAVDLPEVHMPHDTDAMAPAVFNHAKRALAHLKKTGALIADPEPALYVYRLTWRGHAQTGLVGCFAVDDYLSGAIARHETTRAAKEEGRLRHIQALNAQTGLVFLTWPEQKNDRLVALLAQVSSQEPLYDFCDAYGVTNELWRVTDPSMLASLEAAVRAIPKAYIADGHHRAAAAVRHGVEERKARAAQAASKGAASARESAPATSGGDPQNDACNSAPSSTAPSDYFLAGLYPASELTVLAYHRVVADRAGYAPQELIAAIERAGYKATPLAAAPELRSPGELGLFSAGQWWRLQDTQRNANDLDVAHLQARILDPLLGIKNPREDPRISFIGGTEGPQALEAAAGSNGVAFLLFPTTVSQLMATADAGATMPPKSTWFEPKLRSGLLLHPLNEHNVTAPPPQP